MHISSERECEVYIYIYIYIYKILRVFNNKPAQYKRYIEDSKKY